MTMHTEQFSNTPLDEQHCLDVHKQPPHCCSIVLNVRVRLAKLA